VTVDVHRVALVAPKLAMSEPSHLSRRSLGSGGLVLSAFVAVISYFESCSGEIDFIDPAIEQRPVPGLSVVRVPARS